MNHSTRRLIALVAVIQLAVPLARAGEAEPETAEGASAIGVDAGQAFFIAGAGPAAGSPVAAWGAAAVAPDRNGGAGGGKGLSANTAPYRLGETASAAPPTAPPPATPTLPPPPASANSLLKEVVVKRSDEIAWAINSTGGYRFDGYNDCYGFVRRVWDPIRKFIGLRPLPVNDYVSSEWKPVTNWRLLRRGDVLGTHQGHKWGKGWHGGLFWGVALDGRPIVKDSHPRNSGVKVRVYTSFKYYHAPTHELLTRGE